MKTILLVCTGNTCRSSMAEGILKSLVYENPALRDKIKIVSAGVAANSGQGATPQAIQALGELGIDISDHRAAQADEEMLRNADIILTMTQGHKQIITLMDPAAADRVFTLKEYVGGDDGDILDPFGQPVEEYKKCAAEIRGLVAKLVDKLSAEPK